jgi:hypothetical protein
MSVIVNIEATYLRLFAGLALLASFVHLAAAIPAGAQTDAPTSAEAAAVPRSPQCCGARSRCGRA